MKEQKDIVIVDWGGRIPTDSEEEYLAHLLCLGGTCRYRFNERDFELHAGDLSIIRKRKLIERIEPSDDFRCKIIYVTPGFVELCTPQSNYGMKGQLALPQSRHAALARTADCLPTRFRPARTTHHRYGTSFLPRDAHQRHAGRHPRLL